MSAGPARHDGPGGRSRNGLSGREGRVSDALRLLEANLKRRRSQSRPVQPDTAVAMNNLANAYRLPGE